MYPWLTRNMIYGRLRRILIKAQQNYLESTAIIPTTTIVPTPTTIECSNLSGRPVGSTVSNILDLDSKKRMAANDIATLCLLAQQNNKNGRLKRNEYKIIHNRIISKYNINEIDPDYSISKSTIDTRIRRKSLSVDAHNNQQSPIAEIEPILNQIVLWKQEAGQPITPTKGLELAKFTN